MRYQWPLKHMAVGDAAAILGVPLGKAQVYVHTYARSSGRKFKTKSVEYKGEPCLLVLRLADDGTRAPKTGVVHEMDGRAPAVEQAARMAFTYDAPSTGRRKWGFGRLDEGDSMHIYGASAVTVSQSAYLYGQRHGAKFRVATKHDERGREYVELTRANLSGTSRRPDVPYVLDFTGRIAMAERRKWLAAMRNSTEEA